MQQQVSEDDILPLLFFYLQPAETDAVKGVRMPGAGLDCRRAAPFFPAFRIRLPVNLSVNDAIMPAQQPVCGLCSKRHGRQLCPSCFHRICFCCRGTSPEAAKVQAEFGKQGRQN